MESQPENSQQPPPPPSAEPEKVENGNVTNGALNGSLNGSLEGTNGTEPATNGDSAETEDPALFEAPDELPTGLKRDRKSTVRLTDQLKQEEQLKQTIKKWSEPEGKGSHLFNHSKVKSAVIALEKDKQWSDLKILFKFCYGHNTVKKDDVRRKLLRFRGLDFTAEDKEKREKHEEMLGLYPLNSLKWAMTQLGVQKPPKVTKEVEVTNKETGEKTMKTKTVDGDKDAIIEMCMKWLYEPRVIKVVKPKPKKPLKKKETAKKRKNENKDSSTAKAKKSKPEKNSTSTKKTDKSKNSMNPIDKVVDGIANGNTNNTTSAGASSDSDDDKPLKPSKSVDKTPKPPQKRDLRRAVHRILKKANLEEVTMKLICNQVYDLYPDFREKVMARKADIKEIVKEYISKA